MSNLTEFKKPKKRSAAAVEKTAEEQQRKKPSIDIQRRQYELFLERKRNGLKTRENPPAEYAPETAASTSKKADSKESQSRKENKSDDKNALIQKSNFNSKNKSSSAEIKENKNKSLKSKNKAQSSTEIKEDILIKNKAKSSSQQKFENIKNSTNSEDFKSKKDRTNKLEDKSNDLEDVKSKKKLNKIEDKSTDSDYFKSKNGKSNKMESKSTDSESYKIKKDISNKMDIKSTDSKHSKTQHENKESENYININHDTSQVEDKITNQEETKDNKHKMNKREIKHTRSNPKYEYVLDDAKPDEKELIIYGTITDRINCLSLLCARNPSADNYKQLLMFCKDQRSEVKCSVLRNLRDLLKENIVDDSYIKGRILKSFEMGVKNHHIKSKVVEYIGYLARNQVYAEEFISILVSRLIESKEQYNLVCSALNSVFLSYEEIIIENIEDFYYKNDNFKSQYHVLKFLSKQTFINQKIAFDFYQQAFRMLDEEYSEDHKNLMIEYLINGIAATASKGDEIESIDRIRTYLGKPKTVVACLRLLNKIADPLIYTYIQRVIKANVLRCSEYEIDLLNIIYSLNNAEFFGKLVNDCFYHSVEYILSVILLVSNAKLPQSTMYGLRILVVHYHPLVRNLALKVFKGEAVAMFDPFDSVMVNAMTRILETKK